MPPLSRKRNDLFPAAKKAHKMRLRKKIPIKYVRQIATRLKMACHNLRCM